MKKNRTTESLNVSTSRWLAYAAAGAATALAGTQSAEAEIHYSGRINVKVTGSHTFPLDPAGPANLVFWHDYYYYCRYTSSCTIWARSAMFGLNQGSPAGFFSGRFGSVSRLYRGDAISARPFSAGANILAAYYADRGQFQVGDVGFIGFKFNNGSGDQYGWARIRIGVSSHLNVVWLMDYAYADPGESIRAGEKPSHEMVTDEGSLGWLAAGAVGLLAWRKSRSRLAR